MTQDERAKEIEAEIRLPASKDKLFELMIAALNEAPVVGTKTACAATLAYQNAIYKARLRYVCEQHAKFDLNKKVGKT